MLGIQDMVLRKVPLMDHHMLVLMECLVLIILNRVIRPKTIKVGLLIKVMVLRLKAICRRKGIFHLKVVLKDIRLNQYLQDILSILLKGIQDIRGLRHKVIRPILKALPDNIPAIPPSIQVLHLRMGRHIPVCLLRDHIKVIQGILHKVGNRILLHQVLSSNNNHLQVRIPNLPDHQDLHQKICLLYRKPLTQWRKRECKTTRGIRNYWL